MRILSTWFIGIVTWCGLAFPETLVMDAIPAFDDTRLQGILLRLAALVVNGIIVWRVTRHWRRTWARQP